MAKEVDIKVRTVVDSSDLDGLNKKLSNYSEKMEIGVDVDSKSATEKLREVQKKAKELAAEKTLLNIGVATEGLEEIKKIKSEYKALKNMVPPKFRVEMDNTVQDKIDGIRNKINDLDGLSPQIKTIIESEAIDELKAIQTATDNLDGLAPVIKPTVDDSEALGALQNIQNQAEGLSGLESGMAGILGTVGASQLLGGGLETATNMDKAWRNWVGSLQQAGMGFDQATKKADQFKSTVNKLASEGQSTDSLFKNIAGLAINLNNQISDSTLQMTEKVVAGYEMLGGRTGATLYEMEKEVKNFLSTGDLGLMEDTLSSLRDPEKWKGLLEGADTVDERIKIMHDMLQEEGIMGALNIDAPSKSIDQLKAMFDAGMTSIGTTLINIIKPIADGFIWLDKVTNGASTTILSTVAVVGLLGVGLIGLAGALGSVLPGLGNLTSSMARFVGVAGSIPAVPGGAGGGKGGKGGGFLSWITRMNTFASSAAASTGPAALSWTTLSAGISAMLAPMLMVAGVVAVMIPIVAGLAIEVLLFVRLIGEVVKALDFKSLKLDADISGIKQITDAMLNISAAMLAITAVNVVGVVHAATGGIITFVASLAIFVAEIKTAIPLINQLATVPDIDPSIAGKIKQFTDAISNITKGLQSLSSIDTTVALAYLSPLSDWTNNMRRGVLELWNASKEIAKLKNMPSIDTSVGEKIKITSESIVKVGEALSSLGKIDSVVSDSWWNPLSDLSLNIPKGREYLWKAAGELQLLADMPSIPKELAEKVKNASESIVAVGNALKSIGGIDSVVSDSWWDPLSDIANNLPQGRQYLWAAAREVALLKDMPAIPEGTGDKIQRVQWTLTHVVNALNNLNTVKDTLGKVNLSGIIGKLQTARTNIGLASVSLASYSTIANIPDGIAEKIQRVQWTLSHVKNAVTAINNVPAPSESNNVALAVTQIKNAHTELQKLANLSGDGAGITAAVTAVTNTINQIKNTLSAANGVQAAAQNMGSKITTGFKTGAKNLGPASVTVVAAAINAVKNRYDTMRSAGNALGAALASGFKSGAGINSPMAVVVSGMSETLKHITSLTSKFFTAGEALGSAVQDSYRAQHKSTTVAGYTNLINEVKGSVVDLFNNSGFSWRGGSSAAAGGDVISAAGGDFDIESPTNKQYVLENRSLLTSGDLVDEFEKYVNKVEARDKLRKKL